MRFIQEIGPFDSYQRVFDKSNVNYLQLGIEHPYSIPISVLEENDDWPILLKINEKDFYIGQLDLLEFKLNHSSIHIDLDNTYYDTQNDPYLIINIAYEAD